MRAPTDLPRRRRRPSSTRVAAVFLVAGLITLAMSLRGIAGFYTDYLWFDEVKLTSVWKGVLGTKILLGVVFSVAMFVILWVNLRIADRIAPAFRPMGPEEEFMERYHEVVGNRTWLVRIGVATLFALMIGPGASGQWNSWILFRNKVNFGAPKDPLFDKDIGFYVFQLPFLKFVIDWLFAALIVTLLVTAVAHYINGGIRFQTPMRKVTPQVKAHLSVLLGALALVKAAGYFVQRFELVYSSRGVVQGAGYTDVKAQLPALRLLFLISLFAFGLFLYNILRRGWVLPVIAVGLWAMVSVVVGAAYPAAIQKFQVQPNESTKERRYIARNIEATRRAFNLTDTRTRDFAATTDLAASDLQDNVSTIRNIRLWDPLVMRDTYKRQQEIRGFYRFNDVDIDRYDVNGVQTQILLSARELNPGGIPSPSWVNQHLVYTHGYGAVMSPANAVTKEGNPAFQVKDLPPVGSPPLTQPAVYYGQELGSYAIVRTNAKEIDYTASDGTNHTTTYAGKGGVEMSSFIRRAALALRFGDLNPFISDFVTPRSRAMYVRNIDERVRKAAPFLRYDGDPYPIVYRGRVVWMYDAYTTTSRYPYSQRADTSRLSRTSGLTGNYNYVRNSIKVVIDAYDGTMTYYVMDDKDPIAKAYQKAFPKLFTDGKTMDAELREHIRYPEDLFRVQTNMYGQYHMLDAQAFYNRTDAWDIAQEPGGIKGATTVTQVAGGPAGTTTSREARMVPYYLLMRLPGEEREGFLILQPFVPFSKDDSRKDLTAFMVAGSDPENYGQLQTFVMPRQRPIDGPALINARINQEPEISREITFLNSPGQGSKVILGNLLVIPVKESLLYVQPLYVQSDATPLPQLKKVIAVHGDKVVMRNSLRDSLAAIFGSSPSTLEEVVPGQPVVTPPGTEAPPPVTPPDPNDTVVDLIGQANAHADAAAEALRRGDLSAYQRENDSVRDLLRRAGEITGGATTTTTTTVPPPATTTTQPPASA